jgi:hypothetical protein
MSKPERRGPGRAPLPAVKVNAFFHHLGRTGSVTVAANRAQLRRSTLYQRRQDDEAFAERWAKALDLGVERAGEFSDSPGNWACVEKNRFVQAGRRLAIFRTDRFWTSRV